jgi:hypothetical protein
MRAVKFNWGSKLAVATPTWALEAFKAGLPSISGRCRIKSEGITLGISLGSRKLSKRNCGKLAVPGYSPV